MTEEMQITPAQERILLDELEAMKGMSTGEIQALVETYTRRLVAGDYDPAFKNALTGALIQAQAMLDARAGLNAFSDGGPEFEEYLRAALPETAETLRQQYGDEIADGMLKSAKELPAQQAEREKIEAEIVAKAASALTERMQAHEQALAESEAALERARQAEDAKQSL